MAESSAWMHADMARQFARAIAEALYETPEDSGSEMSVRSSENVAVKSTQLRVRDSWPSATEAGAPKSVLRCKAAGRRMESTNRGNHPTQFMTFQEPIFGSRKSMIFELRLCLRDSIRNIKCGSLRGSRRHAGRLAHM